jgi:lysophospholipase L1-like esterase
VVPLKLVAVGLAASLVPLSHGSAPKRYYLALGDSIAYGIQPAKVNAGLPPSGFHTGYVDVFGARLRGLVPKLRIVNYGCPGESTKTFLAGHCPWRDEAQRLHDPYTGSQQRAALAFLNAHPDRVSPITLTLGGNDVGELSDACNGSLACVQARAPAELHRLSTRAAALLSRLRAAAPHAEIIVTGVWNFDVEHLAQTDPLFGMLNAALARAAAGVSARFAPLVPIFNPRGNVAKRKARLCALTFICSRGDPHPTDAGYRSIAAAVWKASGY